MAKKRLSFNQDGFVSEETVERPEPVAEQEEKKRESRTPRAIQSEPMRDDDDERPVRSRRSSLARPAGKSVLDKDVIKFRCPRCSSERVVESKDVQLSCGLCGTAMKLVA